MEGYNCSYGCKGTCIIEVIISSWMEEVIWKKIGVIVGVLFANSVITAVTGFIVIALIIFAITLFILLASLFTANLLDECNPFRKCICKIGTCLLVSSLGGLIAGTIAVILNLTVVAIASILAVAFTAFFFIWAILSILSLVLCLIKETCR